MASLTSQNWSSLPKLAAETYSRHGAWLPALAGLLLVMFIGTQLADLVWTLVPRTSYDAWRPAPVAPSATKHVEPLDLSAIVSAQMFGHPPAANAVASTSAPDTQLALSLMGIFADGRDAKLSRALIGAAGGEEKPYAIGDEITHGVSLQTVFPDRVVLSRNGLLETLRLDKEKAMTGAPVQAEGEAADASAASSVAALSQIRSTLLTDPSKAADYIRIQPVNTGGGLHGYRIYPGKDHSLFTNAGLKPGDVVTAVNGVSLDDPAKSLQLLSDLSQSQQLSVVVDRGGQSQTVTLSLSQ